MASLPTQLPMAAVDIPQPPVQANTPATLDPTASAPAGTSQPWGDILKGVVGHKMFMPALLMAGMMAGSRKKGRGGNMATMLPMMMMMQQLQGATAAPAAPVALPPA